MTENVQTTLVPAGGAAIVEFEMQVPGNYILVDHAIFRAFNKGALGIIAATEPPDSVTYSGRIRQGVYMPEGGAIQTIPGPEGESARASTTTERIAFGEWVYTANCAACHQAGGEGIPVVFPPLANANSLNADRDRAIRALVNGLDGVIAVNGDIFNGVMPALRAVGRGQRADVRLQPVGQLGPRRASVGGRARPRVTAT